MNDTNTCGTSTVGVRASVTNQEVVYNGRHESHIIAILGLRWLTYVYNI